MLQTFVIAMIITIVIVILKAFYLDDHVSEDLSTSSSISTSVDSSTEVEFNIPVESQSRGSSHYNCDGRIRCSQMNSCDEAKFFIQNCPDTQMDGDFDGVPCEDQWCGH